MAATLYELSADRHWRAGGFGGTVGHMRIARRIAPVLLVTLVLAATAHGDSTTGAPGSDTPPPGNRGDLGSSIDPRQLFATKLQVQPRNVTAGEGALAFGTGWFPPFSCKKKGRVKLSVKVPGDKRRKLGSLDPSGGGISIGTGSHEIPFGEQPRKRIPFTPGFSLADIAGNVSFPEKTKPGSGKVLAEQDLHFRVPFLGKCIPLGIGTSELTTVKVLPAKFDSTVITDLAVSAARQAQPVTLRWKLTRGGLARVTLNYLFTRGRTVPVSEVFEGQRGGGANDHTFPMSFDGKALPTGRYRLTVELEDNQGAAKGRPRANLTPARPKSIEFDMGYDQ
jgi:hypothetical protein